MQRKWMATLIGAALLISPTLPESGPRPPEKPEPAPVERPAEKPAENEAAAPEHQGPPAPVPGSTQAPTPEPKPGAAPPAEDGAPQPLAPTADASPPPPPIEKEDPEALKACLADLAALGAKFEDSPPVAEDQGCGMEHPIAVRSIADGVTVSEGAMMRCETALALTRWVKNLVQPALAVAMPGRRIVAVNHASTYVCRLRNNASTGKISEHARGNAIDIADFKLDNGQSIPMQPRNEDSTMEGAFQRAATASACLYFSTVLSPGSDAAHETHLHLDVLKRKNGYRYCR
jgi:hypothetical protein